MAPTGLYLRARGIPILHQIQITLSNLLNRRHMANGHFLRDRLDKPILLLLTHSRPEVCVDCPGTHQIHSNGLQIQSQPSHHTLQTGSVGVDDGPVWHGPFGHRSSGEGDGGLRAGVHVLGSVFPYKQSREETDHAGTLDERHIDFRHGFDSETVSRRMDHMIDSRANAFEELLDVLFQVALIGEIADFTADAVFGGGIGFLELGDALLDSICVGRRDDNGTAVLNGGFCGAVANA